MRPNSVDTTFEDRRRRRHEVKVALGLEERTLEERLDAMERAAEAGDPDAIACCAEIAAILDDLEAQLAAHDAHINSLH